MENIYDVKEAQADKYNGESSVRLSLEMSKEVKEVFVNATNLAERINELAEESGYDFMTELANGFAAVDVYAVAKSDGDYFYEVNGYSQSLDEVEKIHDIESIDLNISNDTLVKSIKNFLDNDNAERTPDAEKYLETFAAKLEGKDQKKEKTSVERE